MDKKQAKNAKQTGSADTDGWLPPDGPQAPRWAAAHNGPRRQWLKGALTGAGAWAVGAPSSALAAPSAPAAARFRTDARVRVAAARLDALVADAFPRFNHPVVLPAFDAARMGARHDVELHRLSTTVTLPRTGEPVEVTGLLAVPVGVAGPLPVVSWQHGTILSFDQVPSNLVRLADPAYRLSDAHDSLETLFNVQRFAGQGFAVIAADYVGKGPLRHSRGEAYAVQDTTVDTCIALLDAGMAAMHSLQVVPGPLFLNGWSQGALNTQWLHQALRRQSREVTASAVCSPFNDLSEAWRFWAGVQTFPHPAGVASYPELPDWISLCMIVALGSYQQRYGLEGLLKSAIRPEFHDMAHKFWLDYALDFNPAQAFPSGRHLLVPGFFDRFTDDRNSAFLRHMAQNSATYWSYDRPMRFHYGLADEAIHPAMVGRALAAGGAQTSAVAIAGASHRGTFLAAHYGDPAALDGRQNILDWFQSERTTARP